MKEDEVQIHPIGYVINIFLIIMFSPFLLLAFLAANIWDFFGGVIDD